MSLRIELPWPPKVLSPNARAHWAPKSRAARSMRSAARLLTMSALNGGGAVPVITDGLRMLWTFHPPRAGRFDRDNAVGRCKALQDGIADALGVDDSHFVPTYLIGEPVKGGRVVVEIAMGGDGG